MLLPLAIQSGPMALMEERPMSLYNLYTGIVMLAVALLLIWVGRPNKAGVHRKI